MCQVTHLDDEQTPAVAYCRGIYPWQARTVTEDPFGDFSEGRYLWLLKDVVPLREPVPALGRQGIWDWNESA